MKLMGSGNNTGQLRALQLCLEAWGISCDWDTACDANPIWDTLHSPLMAEHTMDHVSAYLVYSSARALRQDSQGHCLVPASLSGALLQLENIAYGVEDWIARTGPTAMTQLLLQRQMVWSGLEPPKLVLVPIIDHLNAHCYLWFGAVRRCSNSGLYNLDLSLLDSLGSPSRETVRARLAACISVLQFLLPQVNGAISGKHLAIPGYQQAAGSTDCGYFVCQAISAITYGQRQSLKSLFPVKLVKESVLEILESCKGGVLKDLVTGYAPTPPIILHLPPSYAPPPWLQKPTEQRKQNTVIQVQTWTPPMLKRSLSEPLGDCKSGVGLGSWEEIFGPTVHVLFEQVSGAAFQGYLEAVSNGTYIAPQGLLANSGGPVPQSLMQGLLLAGESELIPWAPDVLSSEGSDEEGPLDPEGGTGLRRFLQGLSYLQEGRERSLAMLTGEHRNQPLHLNWTKETVDISEEWFTAGLDVDSLSLTATQPQFTSGVVFYAYPPRSGTLTTDNGLSVKFEGTSKKLSHIPNLAFAHAGSHNQFRVNIFFPHYQKGQNSAKQYITMMNEQDFTQWYDDVVWQAICRMEILCPEPYRHAATCLRQLLPRSYQNAKLHATQGGLESKGYKILPELFNLLLHYARKIVERNPRLFKFKDFFLHVWGTNLKAIGHEVWRKDGNALLHVLKSFPIVDWSLQNPRDIAVDVGLELNIQQDTLPSDIDGLTLLWRLGALKSLARHGWRKAHVDAYVHSHTVGGISASPRSTVASQLYYVHAYMKDKVLTYRHRDSSIGTGFSPEDSLLNSQRYVREVASLSQVLKSSPGSFGVRVEWRCGVWAANQILSLDPTLWIQRFQHTSAIVALRSSDVVRLKLCMLDSYTWFSAHLQKLQPSQRWTEPVILMASVLTYLTHGLVKRPDEMSPSRFMFKSLGIMGRVRRRGFASVPKERLSEDLLGMSSSLAFGDFTILKYSARKNPAGARIKTSHLPPVSHLVSESLTVQRPTYSSRQQATSTGSHELTWVEPLVNRTLATWIWGRLADSDKCPGQSAASYYGPLLLSRWQHCMDTGVRYAVRPSTTGFQKAQLVFSPPNWVLLGRGKVWQTLQSVFLDQVYERVLSMPEQQRITFSQQVRLAVNNVLQTWEFLPCIQKDKVWSYDGSGRTRLYKVYCNPNFRRHS
ncbi:hypothetical protein FRC12_000239 [Ceratobasidium sp. 428]|nr:hypothetical protein FRC12_000239 [Ceratobasidium sp. 428]